MPETKLKSLYLGKSVADLKKHYNIDEAIKGHKAKTLSTSAEKLFGEAVKLRLSGDEELSYVNYMKYLTIVTMVQRLEEYKKEKPFFLQMVGPQNVKNAMDMAEKLAASLEQRYKIMNEQEKIEAEQLAQEEREAQEELERKQVKLERPSEDTILVNGTPGDVTFVSSENRVQQISGADDISISSERLYCLLKENKKNILILDSRPATAYAESHMTLGNCINVPEEIVKPGTSAAALERLLPPDSKLSWSQRKDAGLIVLLDWSTSEKSHQPGTNLYTLKNILIKWDPDNIYKFTPLILEGGYEDWLMTYPMHTTCANVEVPVPPGLPDVDSLLGCVEYPNLVESAEPVIDRTSKPYFARQGSLSADNVSSKRAAAPDSESYQRVISSSTDRMNSSVRPDVNRGAKAAAVQTYAERSREATELLHAREQENKSQEHEDSKKVKAPGEQEVIRITKEKEADEVQVQPLQEREQELIPNHAKLEEKDHIEAPEKQLRKEQLENYRRPEDGAAEKAQSHKEDTMTLARQKGKQPIKMNNRMLMMMSSEERQRLKNAEKPKKLREEKRNEKNRDNQENEKGIYYTQLRSGDMPSSTSVLKRSHSSPNIAQMMDDLDIGVKHKVPQFDRTIKPLQKPQPSEIKAARQRNFSPVYGSVGHGLTGLKNLGNSCYMNSVIQCINNTTPLVFYFCEGVYREHVNHHNTSTQGEVAEEVAAVVRALWSGQYRSIACRDLKSVVGQHRKQFQGYEQQDSHEFLTILMDWLHEDLNKMSRKLPLSEIINEDLSPADQAWNKFQKCNKSLIQNLFYGQQKSTVRCCKCFEESVTYEAFSDLSLPLPSSSNKCLLADCLKLYLTGEKISGWNCPSCKEKRDAIKKFDIWRLPPILVIHLNRFYHDGWWRKRQTYVDFPFDMDMHCYTPVPQQRYHNYKLYGVSNHYGTMEGGHYTAYCKNTVYNKWYKFDDHEVGEICSSDVGSGAAYILFYAALEYKVPGINS